MAGIDIQHVVVPASVSVHREEALQTVQLGADAVGVDYPVGGEPALAPCLFDSW